MCFCVILKVMFKEDVGQRESLVWSSSRPLHCIVVPGVVMKKIMISLFVDQASGFNFKMSMW